MTTVQDRRKWNALLLQYVFSEIFLMYDLTALIMYFPLLESHIITELKFPYFIMK